MLLLGSCMLYDHETNPYSSNLSNNSKKNVPHVHNAITENYKRNIADFQNMI